MTDPYKIAWVLWIVVFAIIEGLALRNKRKGDTLSENVREVFGTSQNARKSSRYVKLRRLLLLAGLAWFTVHILTPGWV